jgi:hypothetical protein
VVVLASLDDVVCRHPSDEPRDVVQPKQAIINLRGPKWLFTGRRPPVLIRFELEPNHHEVVHGGKSASSAHGTGTARPCIPSSAWDCPARLLRWSTSEVTQRVRDEWPPAVRDACDRCSLDPETVIVLAQP